MPREALATVAERPAAEEGGVLWMSRLALDRAVRDNPYEAHRRVWLAFPGMPRAARPFLFRARSGPRPEALVQSRLRPAAAGRRGCRVLEARPFRLDLRRGAEYAFALRANPVRRDIRTGRRVALSGERERREWLERRFAGAARIVRARVEAEAVLRFRKRRSEGVVATVDFAGALVAEDADGLARLLREGIGPAKGLGCGLAVLAPPHACPVRVERGLDEPPPNV